MGRETHRVEGNEMWLQFSQILGNGDSGTMTGTMVRPMGRGKCPEPMLGRKSKLCLWSQVLGLSDPRTTLSPKVHLSGQSAHTLLCNDLEHRPDGQVLWLRNGEGTGPRD